MQRVTIIYTRRRLNPISALIRWAMPRSRFAWSLSSHAIVDTGEACYEATMTHGVRDVSRDVALRGQTVVRQAAYGVTNLDAGVAWAKQQLCRYQPVAPAWMGAKLGGLYCAWLRILHSNYDWEGAAGLSLAPDRNWAEEDCWFCYEFAAAFLREAGGPRFANLSHIGETALLAVAD